MGFQLIAVAVAVQVYELTGSWFKVGLVGLVGLVLFGRWGGAVADAVDRRVLLLGSSLLLWGCTRGLLGAALAGVASLPLLLGLVAVQAAGFAVASSTPGGDRAPGAARGAGAVGQHPVVHRLQRRPGARPPAGRADPGPLVVRGRLRRRPGRVHLRPVRGGTAAGPPSGRAGHDPRPTLGGGVHVVSNHQRNPVRSTRGPSYQKRAAGSAPWPAQGGAGAWLSTWRMARARRSTSPAIPPPSSSPSRAHGTQHGRP